MVGKKVPKVTVVILNLNGVGFTRKCVESVLASDWGNFEILLMDNGSEGGEAEKLEKEFASDRVRVVKNRENLGFAKANNVGARLARSKYLVFLNNDAIVDKEWLQPLVEVAEADEQTVACQPKILSVISRGSFDYAGAAGGYIDRFGYPFARGRVFFNLEEDVGQYDDVREVGWACGVAMFVKRKQFLELGGFDEDFFIYHEETDLCWRWREKGYKIFCVPRSVVYHYGSGFVGKNLPWKVFLIHRNMWLMGLKHLSLGDLLLHLGFDLASVIFYLSYLQWGQVKSVFKAYGWLVSHWQVVEKKRREYKPTLRRDFLYPGSVAVEGFLRGKRKFSDLNF